MAVLDPRENTIVLSVVYDGPPEAGKTTSLRALGKSLGREVITPEEETGRTVYFDWMEYVGGRFDGQPIRCQVVSVPGQASRAARRERFLAGADVVVFVGDTSAEGWPESCARLVDLRARLDARGGPRVGIVFQANKRDRADAVPLAEVRALLAGAQIGVVESVAHEATGIREAFVLSVRLALDRVREQQQRGELPAGTPDGSDELLASLRRLEGPRVDEEVYVTDRFVPRAPGADVPVGVLWPPVDGRLILHEVAGLGVHPRVTQQGDCVAGLGIGWRLHSLADAVHADLEAGRRALIGWARQHAAAGSFLSAERCIVLADNGDGRWRLWQIVRALPCLRELLLDEESDARGLALRIVRTARLLADAQRRAEEAGLALACSPDTIGLGPSGLPVYVALMPAAPAARGTSESLAAELAALFEGRPGEERLQLRAALTDLPPGELAFAGGGHFTRMLAARLAP